MNGPCSVVITRPSGHYQGARSRPTSQHAARRRERPGGHPVFQKIGADSAEQELLRCSLAGRWTDSDPAAVLCAPHSCPSSIASTPLTDAGDGVQPQHPPPRRRARQCRHRRERCPALRQGPRAMSHVAIAAALALEDVSAGERLAAFSLASFANREHRAWPETRLAAVRAGLSRSQYLAAREGLRKRGLVAVEESGGGRGHSPVVALLFAHTGPWCEGDVNAQLFEATLGYSRAKGSARLLLATLAALAGDQLDVNALSTDEIRAAAGMADGTYRRARAALLASGELILETAGGGRARTNRWVLRDPRSGDPQPAIGQRTRVAPSSTATPLIAVAKESPAVEADGETARDADTVNGPGLTGWSSSSTGAGACPDRRRRCRSPACCRDARARSGDRPPRSSTSRHQQDPRTDASSLRALPAIARADRVGARGGSRQAALPQQASRSIPARRR